MNSTHYVLLDATQDTIVGTGYSPDGKLPPNAIACTQEIVRDETGYSGYTVVNRQLVPPTPDAALAISRARGFKAYEKATQRNLDNFALSWGYDDLNSAASYANSTWPKFKAEAAALIAWRDATWQDVEIYEARIKAGTTPAPTTPAEFVALMPAPPARPNTLTLS
jgi:hypothetical protein